MSQTLVPAASPSSPGVLYGTYFTGTPSAAAIAAAMSGATPAGSPAALRPVTSRKLERLIPARRTPVGAEFGSGFVGHGGKSRPDSEGMSWEADRGAEGADGGADRDEPGRRCRRPRGDGPEAAPDAYGDYPADPADLYAHFGTPHIVMILREGRPEDGRVIGHLAAYRREVAIGER